MKTEATTSRAMTMPPVTPRKRKKLSIFTSSTKPYGPLRKSRMAGTGIDPTA